MEINGVMTMYVNHADGTIDKFTKHNMVVKGGIDFICDSIGNQTRPNIVNKICVGSGSSETTAEMTALESKIAEMAATYSHDKGTNTFVMSAHFGAGAAVGAISEAGVFNADDTMLDRATFKTINTEADDEITVNFTFTVNLA